MARQPRLAVTGQAHLVTLIGNNRQPVFILPDDRRAFLEVLMALAQRERVQVHAWVLLDSEVRLLLTPLVDGGLPRLMQSLGRSYVRGFNQRHGRTGTLWEGRYRSTVLQPGRFLVPCMADMDLLPVRAGLVHAPDAYPWSSHLHYIGRRNDPWVTPHSAVWALGNTPFAREAAYAELVQRGLSLPMQRSLDDAGKGWALGDAAFLAELGQQTQRRLVKRRPGRPRGPSAVGSA